MLYCTLIKKYMVVYHSLTVMACGDVTMVTDWIPFWVPVRPSVKRATPYSKNALWYRTTVKSQVDTVFRVVWYTSAIQECVKYAKIS